MINSLLLALTIQEATEDFSPEVRRELIKVEEFLSRADTIQTIVSDRAQGEDGKEELYGGSSAVAAGRVPPPKPQMQTVKTQNLRGQDREKVVSFFRSLTKAPIQGPAKCFFPRHSIFARKGASRMNVQICYECVAMTVKSSDKKINLYTGMNRNSRTMADKLFGYVSKNSKA